MQSRMSEMNDTAMRSRRWIGCRLMSAVPPSHRRDGIEWISVEHGPAERGGYVLFRRRRREDDPAPDSWHPTLQSAMREARQSWGIDTGCWMVE